jgi:hypothetical protein
MYAVTRQHYISNDYVVEVAIGGLEYANPDALVPKYPGEAEEYKDPRKAVEVAIRICKQWRKDGCNAKLAIGFTRGYTIPCEYVSFKQARKWAKQEYNSLPKCPVCGRITLEQNMACSYVCELEM